MPDRFPVCWDQQRATYIMSIVRVSAFLAGWLSGANPQHPCAGGADRLWKPLPHCLPTATGSDPLILQGSYNRVHMQALAHLITPPLIIWYLGLFSSSSHPLPPCPRALLFHQPALPSPDPLQQHLIPSSCLEPWLGTVLCNITGHAGAQSSTSLKYKDLISSKVLRQCVLHVLLLLSSAAIQTLWPAARLQIQKTCASPSAIDMAWVMLRVQALLGPSAGASYHGYFLYDTNQVCKDSQWLVYSCNASWLHKSQSFLNSVLPMKRSKIIFSKSIAIGQSPFLPNIH